MTFNEQLDIYLSTTEMLQHGVMWLDENGNILGVNSSLAKELGHDKSAFRRKSIFQVNPKTTFMEWQEVWKKFLAERQISIETELLTNTGSVFPVKLRGLPMPAGDEEVCLAIVENLLEGDRYRDLLRLTENISRTGSWEWDLMHDEVVVSEGMRQLVGLEGKSNFKLDEEGSIFKEKLYPEDFKALREGLEKAVRTGEQFDMEIMVKKTLGENLRLNLLAQPVREGDMAHKVCGVLRDLSKVNERTDELYLTKFCVDNASQMVYWLDPDGNFIYANQAFCRRLGYEMDELLRLTLYDIEPQLKKKNWRKRWQELKKKKRLELLSTRRTRQGADIPVRLVLNHVSYGGKEYELAFVLDRKAGEEGADLMELSFRSLEQAREMIYWLNPDGSFFYFNDTFCNKIGYKRKELERKSLFDLMPGLEKSEFEKIWEELREEPLAETERVIAHRDGKKIPVEATVTLVEINGKEFSCTTMRDITLRRKREAERDARLEQIEQLKAQLEEENIQLKEDIEIERGVANIISRSAKYKPVLQKIGQVADTDATVLITGETGTGKELVAQAIHRFSNRAGRSMVKINCGALPANLIESELFGHEKGAFTGAFQRKNGRFERADRSTLFLDEIGELPLDLQAKLLRVLQEGEFERVGGNETIKVDVRIIAATNRNLEERSRKGEFREDLFYRLNVFPIHNIPLRERSDDIPILVKHFVGKYNKKLGKKVEEVPQSVMRNLMKYEFPGNVRELENLIERAIILSNGKKLSVDFDFRRKNRKGTPKNFPTMEQVQREHILAALKRTRGKITGTGGAAELLGLKDKTLYSRMTKLGIGKMDFLK